MTQLLDITEHKEKAHASTLQWVGMEGISIPIIFPQSKSESRQTIAFADIYVSLDKAQQKGIHMSRLYLLLNEQLANQELSNALVENLLQECLNSQNGLSRSAKLTLKFSICIKKPALLSDHEGYQTYPIELTASYKQGSLQTTLSLEIPYSSTCPYSASLSRQSLTDHLLENFTAENFSLDTVIPWLNSPQGTVAVPHSQRSFAYINMSLDHTEPQQFSEMILRLEQATNTPLQTAVKRQDEQEFARLNGKHLKFCEDAAKQVKSELNAMANVTDYQLKIEHQESLHAHNAVVIDSKHYQE